MSNVNDIIAVGFANTELFKMTIPKVPKIGFDSTLINEMQRVASQASKASLALNAAISGLTPKMIIASHNFAEQNRAQIAAIQSVTSRIGEIFKPYADIQKQLKGITPIPIEAIEALKNVSSINVFEKYNKTILVYGGGLDLNSFSEEDVESVIEDNKELINGVNTVIVEAENNNVAPGDISALIYEYLVKVIPTLKKEAYGIIVLIFVAIVFQYDIYSTVSTNKAIDNDIVPEVKTIKKITEKTFETVTENKIEIDNITKKLESDRNKTDSLLKGQEELQKEILDQTKINERNNSELNSKLDLLLKKMEEQESKDVDGSLE